MNILCHKSHISRPVLTARSAVTPGGHLDDSRGPSVSPAFYLTPHRIFILSLYYSHRCIALGLSIPHSKFPEREDHFSTLRVLNERLDSGRPVPGDTGVDKSLGPSHVKVDKRQTYRRFTSN